MTRELLASCGPSPQEDALTNELLQPRSPSQQAKLTSAKRLLGERDALIPVALSL